MRIQLKGQKKLIASFDLPFDAITHILSLLPLNAKFSSKCVCTLWHNVLMEPSFSWLNPNPAFASGCWAPGCLTNGLLVGNSCKGLVCLCNKINGATFGVWDPNLNEIVYRLPEVSFNSGSKSKGASGLGFRSKTNEYKVVWIRPDTWEAEILTLGQEKWRRLGTLPCQIDCNKYHASFGTFFRGALHWIVHGHDSELICLVDMETEKFHSLPPPPGFFLPSPKGTRHLWSNLGVLDDGLYICATDDSLSPHTDVWIMGNYGVKESWAKAFSIKNPMMAWWNPYRSIKLIKFQEETGVLLLSYANAAILCYNSRKGELIKYISTHKC